MNKKIITIAEIVFALIFVVLLALFMSTVSSKGNSANTQLINTLEQTSNTGTASYDGREMKGEAVKNAIENVKTIGGDTKLEIVVHTIDNTAGTAYGYVGGGTTLKKYTVRSASDADYINPTADFQSTLIKNDNDIVIAIHFEQIKPDGTKPVDCSSTCIDSNGVGDYL